MSNHSLRELVEKWRLEQKAFREGAARSRDGKMPRGRPGSGDALFAGNRRGFAGRTIFSGQ